VLLGCPLLFQFQVGLQLGSKLGLQLGFPLGLQLEFQLGLQFPLIQLLLLTLLVPFEVPPRSAHAAGAMTSTSSTTAINNHHLLNFMFPYSLLLPLSRECPDLEKNTFCKNFDAFSPLAQKYPLSSNHSFHNYLKQYFETYNIFYRNSNQILIIFQTTPHSASAKGALGIPYSHLQLAFTA
jgi:hypothetical protein